MALITDESTLAFADVLLGSLRNTCPPIRARIRVTRVVFRLTVRSGKDAFACAVVKIVFELVARTTVLAWVRLAASFKAVRAQEICHSVKVAGVAVSGHPILIQRPVIVEEVPNLVGRTPTANAVINDFEIYDHCVSIELTGHLGTTSSRRVSVSDVHFTAIVEAGTGSVVTKHHLTTLACIKDAWSDFDFAVFTCETKWTLAVVASKDIECCADTAVLTGIGVATIDRRLFAGLTVPIGGTLTGERQ